MRALPKKIVLCGVIGSGKSTLAEHFVKDLFYREAAFANPLKDAALAIFGFEPDHLWGHSSGRETPYEEFAFSGWCFECAAQSEPVGEAGDHVGWWCPRCKAEYPKHVTPRLALQTLGNAWARKLCGDLVARSCFSSMQHNVNYVVSDCRFPNERYVARSYGAVVVLLRRGLDKSTSPHPSEAEVRRMAEDPAGFDVVLDNTTGSPDANFDKLLDALEQVVQRDFTPEVHTHVHRLP